MNAIGNKYSFEAFTNPTNNLSMFSHFSLACSIPLTPVLNRQCHRLPCITAGGPSTRHPSIFPPPAVWTAPTSITRGTSWTILPPIIGPAVCWPFRPASTWPPPAAPPGAPSTPGGTTGTTRRNMTRGAGGRTGAGTAGSRTTGAMTGTP